MIAQFLIGGTSSRGGKTTLTTGLLRLLRNRGYRVQPFKCGPDYIDPQYHKMASGRVSINLDNWLASGEHLHNLYTRHSQEADISVTEGVMGLFDGYKGMEGSSARIAELLDPPASQCTKHRLFGSCHAVWLLSVLPQNPSHWRYL